MLAFRAASRVVSDKQVLQERLKAVPSIVLDGLLSRFTESSRDKNEYVVFSLVNTRAIDGLQSKDHTADGDNASHAHVRALPPPRRLRHRLDTACQGFEHVCRKVRVFLQPLVYGHASGYG